MPTLAQLRADGRYTDVVLVSEYDDTARFKAHRDFLASKASYFHALFYSVAASELESDTATVRLPVDGPTLALLVEALYQGVEHTQQAGAVSRDNCQAVLLASSFLGFPELQRHALEVIEATASADTFFSDLALTEAVDAPDSFVQRLVARCARDLAGLLAQPQAWEALAFPTLLRALQAAAFELSPPAPTLPVICGWVGAEKGARLGHLPRLLRAQAALQPEGGGAGALEAAAARGQTAPLTLEELRAARQVAGMEGEQAPARLLLAMGGYTEGWIPANATVRLRLAPGPGPGRPPRWERAAHAPKPALAFSEAVHLRGRVWLASSHAGTPVLLQRYDRAADVLEARLEVDARKLRACHAAAPLSGQMFLLGPRQCCTFSPGTPPDGWDSAGSTADFGSCVAARASPQGLLGNFAVGAVRDRLYAAGGLMQDRHSVSGACEAYDPARDEWVPLGARLGTPRRYCKAATLEGRLFVVGGVLEDRSRTACVESFDPREGKWRQEPPMATRRSSCGAAAALDALFVAGGSVSDNLLSPTVEVFQLRKGQWGPGQDLPEARMGFALLAI